MQHQNLANRISPLSDEQAAAVEAFIQHLQKQPRHIPQEQFRDALDSFIRE